MKGGAAVSMSAELVPGQANPTNDELIELWCEYHRAARHSPETIRVRRLYLARFARWFGGSLLSVTLGDLVAFMASSPGTAQTQGTKRASLRTFYAWCAEEGYLDASPARRLPSVRIPPAVPRPVTEDALREAMERANDRVRLMIALGAYAGLRRAEIAGLHRSMITDTALVITGKGGRTRLVPLHPTLRALLDAWPEQGWIFPSRKHTSPHVSPCQVGTLLKAAIPGYTAHKLRHRFATKAYAGTRDLFAVQQLLGHSNPETTARYVQMPQDAMLAAVLTLD